MAAITFSKGSTIHSQGQPLTELYMLTKGKVQVSYPGGHYQLNEGDIIGICEICSEVHFLTYTALEDISIMPYPAGNADVLEELLRTHAALVKLFLLSLFRQMNTVLSQSSNADLTCSNLYQTLADDNNAYTTLCNRYRVTPRPLQLENADEYNGESAFDVWLIDYYQGLQHAYAGEAAKYLSSESGITMGLLQRGSQDFRTACQCLEELYQYRRQIASFYFNASGDDLFERLTSLYYRLGINSEDAQRICKKINQIIVEFGKDSPAERQITAQRIYSFQQRHAAMAAADKAGDLADNTDAASSAADLSELAGSLSTILEFAGASEELNSSFRQHVTAYKALEDKNASDESVSRLRKQLTTEFNALYSAVFEKAVSAASLPIAVRMFLYFGYVDEELAGAENCTVLYTLANNMEKQNHSDFGVYTYYDWLLAVFDGRKCPGRNEFDEDYFDFIHKQKASGKLSDAQALALEKDGMAKVKFELSNIFPSVNKVTFGRVTTFCPLFTSDNVIKDLKTSLVTVDQISKALEMIKKIDYSAFYRESLDHDNMDVMGKETIHLEYLPDIILMPNVGVRGVMWQEIEGKKRNTPARMMLSIFHLEDINATMIRLTGEFRWEMCKRIQGSRWNDVTEFSLTSEYFDYVQFYRKNRDLSAEAKEKIKTSLQRSRNSFKEMFVKDYISWILFEGTGSPRLNKVARRILLTYCPFPADLSRTMEQNPLFSELISRKNIQTGQRVHHLDMLIQKLKNSGTPIPDTLTAERNFAQGII